MDDTEQALLVFDDFVPLFGTICLFPIVINARVGTTIEGASLLPVLAVATGTLAGIVLMLTAVSSLRLTRVGRYVAGVVLCPAALLALAGLQVRVYYIIGVVLTAVIALTIDLREQ